jgi:hypothetical protein
MNQDDTSLIRAARRVAEALRKETELARRGALSALSDAAADKVEAMREFSRACGARGDTTRTTPRERDELRRVLAAADENALTLESVTSTLRDLFAKVRIAAATAADPGTYSLHGRKHRHVWAASVDASA